MMLKAGAVKDLSERLDAVSPSDAVTLRNLWADLAEARADLVNMTTYRDGLAVTVTELEAQNERMRAALKEIADHGGLSDAGIIAEATLMQCDDEQRLNDADPA